MKSRDYKQFAKDNYYHVFNRGNNREKIYHDNEDYKNFLKRLEITLGFEKQHKLRIEPFNKGLFEVLAYCLMDNHFHLLIKQNSEINIGSLVSKVCTSYVGYFNKKYNRVGHLFQDVYKVRLVTNDSYLDYVSAYIHNNPEEPLTWKYSSLQEYINKQRFCDTSTILQRFKNDPDLYLDFVNKTRNLYKQGLPLQGESL